MKTVIGVLLSLLLVSLPAAADSSGDWYGTITLPGVEDPLTLVLDLEENGGRVSGTAGPNRDNMQPILNGTVQSGRLTLEFNVPELGSNGILTLVQSGEKMTGSAEFRVADTVLTGTVALERGE